VKLSLIKNFSVISLIAVLSSVVLVICDRLSKLYFIKNPSKVIGGDFFSSLIQLDLQINRGVAFGWLWSRPLVISLTIVALIILISLLVITAKQKKAIDFSLYCFLFAGAVSNLYDRLKYGYVIDYIDVPWFTIFNIADILITLSIIGLVIQMFWQSKKAEKIQPRGIKS